MVNNTRTIYVLLLAISVIASIATVAAFATTNTSTAASTNMGAKGFVMGHVTVTVMDENGNVKAYRQSDNQITARGLDSITARIFADTLKISSPAAFDWIALGTDATAPAAAQTKLVGEFTGSGGECRKNATTVQTDIASGQTVIVTSAATWGAGSCTVSGLTEAGIFNTSSSDNTANQMLARNTFTAVNKATTDTLTINWDLTFTDT